MNTNNKNIFIDLSYMFTPTKHTMKSFIILSRDINFRHNVYNILKSFVEVQIIYQGDKVDDIDFTRCAACPCLAIVDVDHFDMPLFRMFHHKPDIYVLGIYTQDNFTKFAEFFSRQENATMISNILWDSRLEEIFYYSERIFKD